MKGGVMKRKLAALMALGLGLAAAPAHCGIIQFFADLDGAQETPPIPTSGTGHVDLEFDTATNTITITSGMYSDLMGGVTAAHIHLAPVGVPGDIIITLAHTGGTSGMLSGGGVLTAAQVTALFNDELYINVHTSFASGGEIRGQIFEVPAPGAFALLGVAGLATTRRRRA
jgi:MYXO-CTERM domain-containing protein